MATIRTTLHHEYRPKVELVPINPVYEDRMYISGWIFGFGTRYKKDMVSCEGYREIWTCSTCGRQIDDKLHQPEILKEGRL